MDVLDLARWQFATTTVYHFFFVPITIGLSAIVAWYHSRWIRTRTEGHLRLTKFFGKILTINIALGLVTGIVQEFQFGMNWSSYSRFVGDVFGAPLALEALLAFFLESVFLGLWIFGWGRLPERLHSAAMWCVHIGTVLSSYFILTANSFMQNPVGYRINPETGRAEMTDFIAILTNEVQVVAFPHVMAASYLVGGALVMGIGLHRMRQAKGDLTDRAMYRHAARLGAIVTLIAGVGLTISGDLQGKVMTQVQPMKMAAAEALYETPPQGQCAPFSVLTIAGLGGEDPRHVLEVPCLLSWLGTGSFDGQVQGMVDLEREYRASFGDNELTASDSYIPPIAMSYWNFRLMIGAGIFAMTAAAWVLWATRGNRLPAQRWVTPLLVLTPLAAMLGNSFGWIFTEVGRQPWVVHGEMTTQTAVSPVTSAGDVITSMLVFTLLYATLAVIEVRLLLATIRDGAAPFEQPRLIEDDEPLQFAY